MTEIADEVAAALRSWLLEWDSRNDTVSAPVFRRSSPDGRHGSWALSSERLNLSYSKLTPLRLHGVQAIGTYVVCIVEIRVDRSDHPPLIFVYDCERSDDGLHGGVDAKRIAGLALVRFEEWLGYTFEEPTIQVSLGFPAILTPEAPTKVTGILERPANG